MAELSADDAVDLVKTELWPALKKERERVARIDKWLRWDHDKPHSPRHATKEYQELASRAEAPWLRRVVTAVTDQLYVEGYREAKATDNAAPWDFWQANGFDSRQIAVHEAAVGYGLAYMTVLPGESWLGERMPVMRALDPSQMIAVYRDPAWDDWPVYALRAEPAKVDGRPGWKFRLYHDNRVHTITASADVDRLDYDRVDVHGAGVCPVVRYANHLDLRGRADGEVEPYIPLAARIDQTAFDRLVVQRFASWKVRTIAGMTPPEQLTSDGAAGSTPSGSSTVEAEKQRLKVEDILVAEDPDTKFGTLEETALSGFIEAHDADVRSLAAVSQTPAHEMLGTIANLSAEALAAAEASLTRKCERTKHMLGEAHEQSMRLGALIMGDKASARDVASQVHWRDMESRSLAQAADALGKLAQMLGVPVEMLWEKIPGWTQQDVDRAKELVEEGGGLEAMMRELAGAQTPPAPVA